MRPLPAITATLALATACQDRIDAPLPRLDEAEVQQPDLVVVTLDTTRADHLGLYGYPRETTPRLDELASEAVVYERFVVPMATTLPVHVSLFTGLEPTEHGVIANAAFDGERFVPPPGLQPLATRLQDAGYTTAAFVSATPVKRDSGIAQGFDTFRQPPGFERPARETVDLALSWLREQAEPPYLLWVHLYDPHHPFAPPRWEGWRMRPDDALRVVAAERGLDEEQLDVLARYDGEIRETDQQLGRLLDSLRAAGRWDRTVLAVIGDHGEGLGQHGIQHHGLVWAEQLHAPLLIRAPGLEPGRDERLATASDLFPTLLALLDAAEPHTLDAQSGRDLLAEHDPRPGVLSRTSPKRQREGAAGERVHETWAWTTAEWTLHHTRRSPTGLFHHLSDPYQQRDRLDDEPERAQRMLREALEEHDQQVLRAETLGAGALGPMEPELILELEALGYVE
jgi:arylsulfatase A-like enzyme